MSDHIEQNGKKYYEEGYLVMANKTAKRRGQKIKELEAEIEILREHVGLDLKMSEFDEMETQINQTIKEIRGKT